jgi:ABC-type amino acid transport system permease subunit
MARSVLIASYGTLEDRLKLAALARLKKTSSSDWLLQQIRAAYVEIYGDAPPAQVVGERK